MTQILKQIKMQCGSDRRSDYYEAERGVEQASLLINYFPITTTITNSTAFIIPSKNPLIQFPIL